MRVMGRIQSTSGATLNGSEYWVGIAGVTEPADEASESVANYQTRFKGMVVQSIATLHA